MRPGPSLGLSGQTPVSEQLLDQRAVFRKFGSQGPWLSHGVLLSLEHQPSTSHMQVHAIAGSQTQRGPYVCRDHQPTLLGRRVLTSAAPAVTEGDGDRCRCGRNCSAASVVRPEAVWRIASRWQRETNATTLRALR
jgi:hypothetical protein